MNVDLQVTGCGPSDRPASPNLQPATSLAASCRPRFTLSKIFDGGDMLFLDGVGGL
jgi:hypothetical protein